jgi:hypothetical protein
MKSDSSGSRLWPLSSWPYGGAHPSHAKDRPDRMALTAVRERRRLQLRRAAQRARLCRGSQSGLREALGRRHRGTPSRAGRRAGPPQGGRDLRGRHASGDGGQGATATIPIVFANVAFPDQSHLVDSYARPGSNVTGVAFIGPEYGKRLELLKEALPKLRRVGLIYNPENRASVLAVEETRRWATTLEVALDAHILRGPEDLDPMFDAIGRSHPDAIMTTADVFIHSYRTRIVQYATKNRLASMFPDKEYVLAGGLMFYGGSIPDMYRRAGIYVDRILKGAKTAELPVEQPTKFDMIVNLKTARALGVTIPPSIILRADQVID